MERKNMNIKHAIQIGIFNLIFWGLSFVILAFAFSNSNSPFAIDYLYSLAFIITLIPPVSINLYVLMPLLLRKKHYFLFVLFFALNLILFTQAHLLFFNFFTTYLFPHYYFISYYSLWGTGLVFLIFLISSMLLKMAGDWFYWQSYKYQQLEEEKHKIQNDLSALRSQINPHFLFNSLNTVYALSLDNYPKTSQALIQLSNILRYVIYETQSTKVDLTKELSILNDYIDFQKNKYRQNSISIEINKDNKSYQIYPMLLLPLLENCFKHGLNDKHGNNSLKVKIQIENGRFQFESINNYSSIYSEENPQKEGIGLQILQKQLQSVYPKRHQLTMDKSGGFFTLNLRISLDTNTKLASR